MKKELKMFGAIWLAPFFILGYRYARELKILAFSSFFLLLAYFYNPELRILEAALLTLLLLSAYWYSKKNLPSPQERRVLNKLEHYLDIMIKERKKKAGQSNSESSGEEKEDWEVEEEEESDDFLSQIVSARSEGRAFPTGSEGRAFPTGSEGRAFPTGSEGRAFPTRREARNSELDFQRKLDESKRLFNSTFGGFFGNDPATQEMAESMMAGMIRMMQPQ